MELPGRKRVSNKQLEVRKVTDKPQRGRESKAEPSADAKNRSRHFSGPAVRTEFKVRIMPY